MLKNLIALYIKKLIEITLSSLPDEKLARIGKTYLFGGIPEFGA